jgi:hypothetical protein
MAERESMSENVSEEMKKISLVTNERNEAKRRLAKHG